MSAIRTIDDNDVWEFKNQIKTSGGVDAASSTLTLTNGSINLTNGSIVGPTSYFTTPVNDFRWLIPEGQAQTLVANDKDVMQSAIGGFLYYKPVWIKMGQIRFNTATVALVQNTTTSLIWTSSSQGLKAKSWPFLIPVLPTTDLLVISDWLGVNANVWMRVTLKWNSAGTSLTQNNQFSFNQRPAPPTVLGGGSTVIGTNQGVVTTVLENSLSVWGFAVDVTLGSQAIPAFTCQVYIDIL